MTAKLVSPWTRDDCLDPCHRQATVEYDGKLYHAHLTAPGYGYTIRPMKYDGRLCHVGRIEDFHPDMLDRR